MWEQYTSYGRNEEFLLVLNMTVRIGATEL